MMGALLHCLLAADATIKSSLPYRRHGRIDVDVDDKFVLGSPSHHEYGNDAHNENTD
jgi:hypothetical protein